MDSPLNNVIPNWGAPTLQNFDTSNPQDGQRIGGSNRQLVRFSRRKVPILKTVSGELNELTGELHVAKSAVDYVEKEFVMVITPGDKNSVDDVATDWHRREFWREYKAFRDGKAAPFGTDLEDCDWCEGAITLELKYRGCHTQEQLADASDLLCSQVPNGWELREYARALCAVSAGPVSKEAEVLRGELEKSQSMIAEMQKQINEMKGMILNAQGQPINQGE